VFLAVVSQGENMEMGEAVAVAVAMMEKEKDPKCDEKDEDKGWKSRVNKFNSQEVCTGTRLYDNMKADASGHEKKGLGVVPPKKAGTKWKLSLVTPEFFPIQAHHLIPKSFLPTHRVCTWLAIKYKENKKYELKYDSNYDTDHADNGYCMPYASPLAEWSGNQSKKTACAFGVMENVGIQLHQGSHATVLDAKKLNEMAGETIVPDISVIAGDGESDDLEDSGIHEPGYLNKVKKLLNVVDAKALSHVDKCDVCKSSKQGKKMLVMPTEGVVNLMHRVSAITKVLIDANVAHVSGYAYFYAYHKGDLEVVDGEVHVRGTKTQLKKSLSS
jgi:hypothetical protein